MKKAVLFALLMANPSVVYAENWQCSAIESYILKLNHAYDDPIYIQKVKPFAPDVQFEWSAGKLKISNGRHTSTYDLHTSLPESGYFVASDSPLQSIVFDDGSLVWNTGTVITGYYCVYMY